MKRRSFLTAASSAAALTALPNCSKDGPGSGKETLNVFIWPEYLPESVIAQFEAEAGCKLRVDTFTTNETMIAKVGAGRSGYDLVCPSQYAVAELARLNLLAELTRANIPGLANIDPRFARLKADPDGKYAVPYLGGTTGIGYNRKLLPDPPRKWADLFDPAKLEPIKGKFCMLDDARETPGAALMALGLSPNAKDSAALAKAGALLKTQKPFVSAYTSEDFEDRLNQGDVLLAHGYSGDFVAVIAENKDLDYFTPEEGAIFSCDCFGILKESARKPLAEKFLNFITRGEISGKICNETGYIPVNTKAWDHVDAAMKDHPCWKLPPDGKWILQEDVGQDGRDAYDKLWEELKSA